LAAPALESRLKLIAFFRISLLLAPNCFALIANYRPKYFSENEPSKEFSNQRT
jgi:hypothetical protein